MILQIGNILPNSTLNQFNSILSSPEVWIDGKATANGRAREVKNNLQLSPNTLGTDEFFATVAHAISSNKLVATAARPDRFARIIVSRYDSGMKYGAHVDATFMDGVRCDISFTLFLSDPASYEGGELAVQSAEGWSNYKLPAGGILLYPSTSVHQVKEVLSGTRYAAIGWIKSRVRSTEQRSMLFELDRSIADLSESPHHTESRTRLANVRNNLLRAWSD